MEILYLIVPIGLVILAVVIKLLFWAINNGQYDDLNTEGQRILFEEDKVQVKAGVDKETVDKKNDSRYSEIDSFFVTPESGTDKVEKP